MVLHPLTPLRITEPGTLTARRQTLRHRSHDIRCFRSRTSDARALSPRFSVREGTSANGGHEPSRRESGRTGCHISPLDHPSGIHNMLVETVDIFDGTIFHGAA